MNRICRLTAAFLSIILAACGNLQAVQVAQMPAPLIGKSVALSEQRPTRDEVAPRSFEVPEKSLFVQQTSGGSVALGLLLGPIGVLANAANIDRITQETGQAGQKSALFQIDAKEELASVLAGSASGPASQSSAEKIALQPYVVYFVAGEKEGIDVVVKLRAEATIVAEGKSVPWVGNYAVYASEILPYEGLSTPSAPGRADGLRSAIRGAYAEMLGEISRDLSAAPVPKRDIAWVKSRILGIGMPGDIERNASGHLVLRSSPTESRYTAVIFQDNKQYTFENGPVPRESR